MSTKSRQTIYGGRIIGAEIRAQGAREAAQKAIREADRAEAESMVDPDGRLWRTRPTLPDHRAMPQWRGMLRLRNIRVRTLAGDCSPSRDGICRMKSGCAACKKKAWRWYEREGFVLEKEQVEPMTGFGMKYHRWEKQGAAR